MLLPPRYVQQQPIGSWLPTVVWPGDVDAYKRKIDPDWRSTNATATTCSALDPGLKVGWADEYKSWRVFCDRKTPIFGAANEYDLAVDYEQRLERWQSKISPPCVLNSPKVVPPAAPEYGIVKWAAAAVIVVGVAYLLSPLVTGAHAKQRTQKRAA